VSLCKIFWRSVKLLHRYGDFLFALTKWQLSAMSDFRNSKFCRLISLRGSQCVIIPNFMAIRQTFAELCDLMIYGDLTGFSERLLSAILILKTGIFN